MRSLGEFETVWALIQLGFSNRGVSKLTGISRSTIREWRRAGPDARLGPARAPDKDCPSCAGAAVDEPAYAYLLGLYLGDGCISEGPRSVFKLRITMDLRYPLIIDECSDAIRAMRPSINMKVGHVAKIGCTEICAHWKHWPCLFPQHGPGPKHERRIELQSWQSEIVGQHPDRLLRGLVHSDGYRGLNYVNGKGYPRYQFCSHSDDIRDIFCRACDVYGVRWRRMNRWTISVARAPDVAKLDSVIGPKT
jgi:hypothetical protein